MNKRITYLAVLAATLAGGLALADNRVEDELTARWVAAYESGDALTLAEIYASDARVQDGYCPSVEGKDAIEHFWRTDLGIGQPSSTRLEITDSFSTGEFVYMSGMYTVDDGGELAPIAGRYSQIWRRQGDQEWLLYRESWINLACANVSRSPTPAEAKQAPKVST